MEISNFVMRIIKDDILEQFFITKEKFKSENYSLKDFIDEKAFNEKFPNIITYKTIIDRRSKDICGFYCLFFTMNYIKYIINNRNLYYLSKNLNNKSFFKFYQNFLNFFIINMTSLEEYEINELKKESSLERHHIDFILKNKLLYKYMKKKYAEIIEKFEFEFEWFDFIDNNISVSDINKIKKLDNIFKEILKSNNEENINSNKIIFLYIGLTEHWILIIYDPLYKNNLIKMDSFYGSRDIINLKYLDEKEIDNYINKINIESNQINDKPLSQYQINLFKNSIFDTHRILYKLNNFVSKVSPKDFDLGINIMEERCKFLIQNYEKLKINKSDKMNELLIIYDWFANVYHPKTLKEEYYDMMNELGIKSKDCKNDVINKFFGLIKELNNFLEENLKLVIEQQDIKDFLEKGFDIINKINKL